MVYQGSNFTGLDWLILASGALFFLLGAVFRFRQSSSLLENRARRFSPPLGFVVVLEFFVAGALSCTFVCQSGG